MGLYIILITIFDFCFFPIRFFFSELWALFIYLISYLAVSYFVLYTIASSSFTKPKSHNIARIVLILLLMASIPVYYRSLTFYVCTSVKPNIEMNRAIPAFKSLVVNNNKFACISEKPLRYITRDSHDFTELMSRNGFYKQEQLGALWIFKRETDQKVVKVGSETYVHSFQLWTFHNDDMKLE